MAITHTSIILKPAMRLVEWCLEPNGFRMPMYRLMLMKHICNILDEHAKTSQVTYTLHHIPPNGQWPENKQKIDNEKKWKKNVCISLLNKNKIELGVIFFI